MTKSEIKAKKAKGEKLTFIETIQSFGTLIDLIWKAVVILALAASWFYHPSSPATEKKIKQLESRIMEMTKKINGN